VAQLTISPRWRRPIGGALVAYGVSGLLLIATAGLLVGGAVATLADASAQVAGQRDDLVATLRATSRTVTDAANGVGGVGASLTAAKTSSEDATRLAGSLGTTLRGLSSAMQVQIFGAQPLAGLSSGFDSAATQSEALATDLGAVSAALGANGEDLETTRRDLVALGERVDGLVDSLEATPLSQTAPGGVPPWLIELAFLGLLVWLALPAAAALAVGIGLLRGTLR
jgi:ABC-type transporter Mla subunit MlaD